ncbi:hypothetical protein [Pseudarthrobacter sp. NamB4]|uniref:hypothetical protein n=1 Tax=Pseudarthrobacter sp. NamB4 TaxID=2576837 RepID=UPI0010FE9CCB|nr:hypothetical protein [Pseudarthrobacter sp. NamB4]TLM73816.1 hypothetical protein FDW81_07795 [Pseudarthrobacter sp. NamB4]
MAEVTPSGSGGPLRLSGPAQDGPLMVRGGVGGISFQLEELTGGGEKLDQLAGKLATVEVEVRRIWEDLIPFHDLPRWTGSLALSAVGESERSLKAVRTELEGISSRVRACRQEYERAEFLAGAARSMGLVSPEDIRNSWSNFSTTRSPDEKMAETLIARLGMEASDIRRLTQRKGWGAEGPDEAGASGPRPLTLRREETIRVDLDASPAGLLERIRRIDARGAGFIEVIEVRNGAEDNAFVVVIPGTQPALLGAGGENPFDEVGIAEAMFNGSRELTPAVLQALREAGAEQGDPVVAVGYSQGGIHAANLAADQRLLSEYDLRYVLTAGSPVAGIDPAPGVQLLHLEHQADWVPGGDGAPNPETRDRITVSTTNALKRVEGEGGLGMGHGLSNYQDAARLVSASGDPSLVASTGTLAAVLGAGGTATATRFSLARTQPPAPAPAPSGPRRLERGHAGR